MMSELKPKLVELFSYMDSTGAALVELARNMNPSFALIRPHEGVWSAANNIAHLAIVEDSIVRMMEKAVAAAREEGIGPDPSDESFMSSLDRFQVPQPVTKIVASDRITPDDSKTVQESLASLEKTRARLKAVVIENSDIDLAAIKRPHPVLRDLDMYQWALFVAQHEERHRRQMERTLAQVTELAAECAPIV